MCPLQAVIGRQNIQEKSKAFIAEQQQEMEKLIRAKVWSTLLL